MPIYTITELRPPSWDPRRMASVSVPRGLCREPLGPLAFLLYLFLEPGVEGCQSPSQLPLGSGSASVLPSPPAPASN